MESKMQPAEIAENLELLRNTLCQSNNYIVDAHGKARINNEFVDALDQAAEIVKNYVEVAHGRWIVKPLPMNNDPPNVKPWNVRIYCSNCEFTTGPTSANFCPNCGAKMDGGDNHETN